MLTPNEIETLEMMQLKTRKEDNAKAIWGSLGSTKFVQFNAGGDFFVQKSLKGVNQMTKSEKIKKMRKLSHEKDMYKKLKDVEGILTIFPEMSANDNIGLECMSAELHTTILRLRILCVKTGSGNLLILMVQKKTKNILWISAELNIGVLHIR
jgi:hypothetical protein